MNQIFFNDPLLYGNNQSQSQLPIYKQDPQFLQQYFQQKQLQQDANGIKDWISELDNTLCNLEPTMIQKLNENPEYVKLNESLQKTIQDELMSFVKQKLNCYPSVAENVKRQIEIINQTISKEKEEEKRNMYELNDYIQNYSNMTFDEYRRIKKETKVQNESK